MALYILLTFWFWKFPFYNLMHVVLNKKTLKILNLMQVTYIFLEYSEALLSHKTN